VPALCGHFGAIRPHTNAHEPVPVHRDRDGPECRAEILLGNGAVTDIRYAAVAGRAPLAPRAMQCFAGPVTARAEEIVQKWIDFFVLNKPVRPERITRRLK